MTLDQPKRPQPPAFSGYQKFVIAILAFLQFTIILDFMILSPLGATMIPALQINASQFGLIVSAYAFCAGLSGFLTAGFADRFDRKKLLLFFYTGFIVGTLLCALAPDYHSLLIARMVTGSFSGVIGSIVFAITTDLFSFEMRGRVMGVVQSSFAASQIMGIPLGLFVSNHWGWNATFFMIVAVGLVVGLIIFAYLRPIDAHLKLSVDRSPLHHLMQTVTKPRYLQGFGTTALLTVGGFMMMPFMSAFSVNNVGISLQRLPLVYMCTGLGSIVAGPLIGRLSDKMGSFRIFVVGCVLTVTMTLIYTHLGVTPIGWVILSNALLYIAVSSRMISSSALVSALPDPKDRGSYMSVSSSIQQISGGISSVISGFIVVQSASGRVEHFDDVGYCVALTTVITVVMMYFINLRIRGGRAAALPVETPVTP